MFDKLVEIMVNYVDVDPEDVAMDTRFVEDLGFTSFDFMSLLGEIETELDVSIDTDKVADIRTVGEAVEYLESLV